MTYQMIFNDPNPDYISDDIPDDIQVDYNNNGDNGSKDYNDGDMWMILIIIMIMIVMIRQWMSKSLCRLDLVSW